MAIAGLIFLMVFIALPNMQASQRNTQRRNDYNSLATQITNYAANHNGSMPTTIKKEWFNSKGTDPDDSDYSETTVTAFGTNPTPGRNQNQAYVITGAYCNAGTPAAKTGKKNFVVYGYVEDGANKDGTYCLESHA